MLGERVALEPLALSAGNSRSVSTTQRATIGSAVVPICLRRRSTALMSHSTIVVQCAAISSERFMCSPIDLRIRDSGSPRPAATARPRRAAAGAAGRGAARPAAGRGGGRRLRRARRGRLGPVRRLDVHRRLGPLLARARPAVLEDGEHVLLADAPAAAGALDLRQVEAVLGGHPRDDRACSAVAVGRGRGSPGSAGSGAGSRRGRRRLPGRGRGLAGRRRRRARAVAGAGVLARVRLPGRASVAIRASTVPTSTVVADRDDDLRHAARRRRRAPRCRSCPSRLSTSAPRTRPSRRAACATRRWCPPNRDAHLRHDDLDHAGSGLGGLTGGLLHAVDAGQDRLLERRGERDRDVGRRDARAPGRRGPRRRGRRSRAATWAPAAQVWLASSTISDLARLAHRREDRLLVERDERAQVEHLDRRAVEVLGRLERGVDHRAVGDHGEVGPFARDARAERSRCREPSGSSPFTRRYRCLCSRKRDRVVVAHGRRSAGPWRPRPSTERRPSAPARA